MKKFNGCVVKGNAIVMTKAFAKQAYTPGTAEFRHLAELHKAFPEFSIEMRTATPKEDKEKHNGLTVARMEFLIKSYLGDEIALAEFTEVQKFYKGTNLQMKAETFAPREYQKPVLDYSEALEAMQTKIRLRIHKSILDRVLDFCGFENFAPDGEEHYLVEYPFIENDYYLDMLLSFGKACECLAPTRIREELKRRAQAIAAMYE